MRRLSGWEERQKKFIVGSNSYLEMETYTPCLTSYSGPEKMRKQAEPAKLRKEHFWQSCCYKGEDFSHNSIVASASLECDCAKTARQRNLTTQHLDHDRDQFFVVPPSAHPSSGSTLKTKWEGKALGDNWEQQCVKLTSVFTGLGATQTWLGHKVLIVVAQTSFPGCNPSLFNQLIALD